MQRFRDLSLVSLILWLRDCEILAHLDIPQESVYMFAGQMEWEP